MTDPSPPQARSSALTPAWHAGQTPSKAAIVMAASGHVTTYEQLDERSRQMASALGSRGLSQGAHVALLMENSAAFLEVSWAAQRSGLRYTPISSHLTAGEVQYVLDDCGASALVTTSALAAVVEQLDLSRVPVRIGTGRRPAGFEAYEDVLAAELGSRLEREQEGREMLYSSGTTGRPKGVQKPLPNAAFGDPSSAPVLLAQRLASTGFGPGTVYLSPAPLHHAAPLFYTMAVHRLGGTVVVMERFDAQLCLDLIEQHRVTHAQFVPTMFTRLLRLPPEERERADVSSLVLALHAGAPCPVPVKRQMLDWWGPIVHEYYSGTEGVGSSSISAQEWLAHPGSVGRPAQECHVIGDDGHELPAGEQGLVYFAGGLDFSYHNDPDKTAEMSDERGWRTFGDIGYLDADGYLYLTDRQAHMIISGGVNIYPQEAENVLLSHPVVADVAVIGVPDLDMGEAVKAVVEVEPGVLRSEALRDELIAFCRASLAPYKCPRTVDFVDSLPREENGKLYKRLVKDAYWQGHESRLI